MTEESSHGSVPLIPLHRRNQYARLSDDHERLDLDATDTAYRGPAVPDYRQYHQPQPSPAGGYPQSFPYSMARIPPLASLRPQKGSKKSAALVISSYVFDWITILVTLGVAYYLGNHPPNRRPFSLEDPNISFPYTEDETVPSWLLVTLNAGVPIVVVLIISLIFVPGSSVPPGTPKSLVWKRKLWELHVGWLGLALSLASAWFITNGMKNLFGKPRPDALARCNPDIENFAKYVVGGVNVADGFQRLVSADICQGMANHTEADTILEDGFRSYPSGHASSAAAGLIYLSLFIASKFAITFPFLTPGAHQHTPTSFSAFPSRRPQAHHQPLAGQDDAVEHPPTASYAPAQNAQLSSARRQAAAPPLYLLIFAVAPFFTAVFIASSRWFDFRHHGFDILFGFIIGLICAFFAFRWYHLPVSKGAGWAWGPRCADKAWWAGVGSFSYAMDWDKEDGAAMGRQNVGGDLEEGRADKVMHSNTASSGSVGVHDYEGEGEARRRMT